MDELRSYTLLSWLHIGAAVLAMVLGMSVLFMRKGTVRHKRTGYAYVASMLAVNGSAFGMYKLFGTFGPFHVAAVISLLTLVAGMRAVLRRPRKPQWHVAHLTYMYWSVIGLYAAFFSELIVRLPIPGRFMWLVGVATGATVLLGIRMQGRLTERWTAALGADAGHAPDPTRSSSASTRSATP